MAPNFSKDSIWRQMNYTPPRGSCNHKDSLLSPKCPCLRFMLHPLKLSSSFTCDGCDHHASFHNMASPADDAIIARWETESQEQQQQNAIANPRPRKRQRLLTAAVDTHAPRASSDNVNNHNRALEFEVDDSTRRRARSASPASEVSDIAAGADALHLSSNSSRTWGERFSSWSFGRVEREPVKTPPKKTPVITTMTTAKAPQGTKGKRAAVPASRIIVKKAGRPKKTSERSGAAGPNGSSNVLGDTNSEPILLSDTEHPD
ncbi:hypothetical protein IWX92DRAFT_233254 [Phyllosticta citricarpa]